MTRTLENVVVEVEVHAGARTNGYAGAHDAELDGDENLEIGASVETRDGAATTCPPSSMASHPHVTGRRYRLRLGR